MFGERVRTVIERQCARLRDDADALAKLLAQYDPQDPDRRPLDVVTGRELCRDVLHRATAMGLEEVAAQAEALDEALGELEGASRIDSWNMVELMARQGDLDCAVDELEADRTDLYAVCSAPGAVEVAPILRPRFP